MDQTKKQNLTPELKQIYDRVMNTQVQAKAATPAPTTPSAPAVGQMPVNGMQTATPPIATSTNAAPNPMPTQPKSAMKFTPPAGGATSSPIAGQDKSFVFTGNKMTTPQAGGSTIKVQTGAGGKRMPSVAIAGLVVVLLVVWGVFWAKLLGLF